MFKSLFSSFFSITAFGFYTDAEAMEILRLMCRGGGISEDAEKPLESVVSYIRSTVTDVASARNELLCCQLSDSPDRMMVSALIEYCNVLSDRNAIQFSCKSQWLRYLSSHDLYDRDKNIFDIEAYNADYDERNSNSDEEDQRFIEWRERINRLRDLK